MARISIKTIGAIVGLLLLRSLSFGQELPERQLLKNLADKSPAIRASAAQALGRMRDPKALNPLMGALSDTDASVRGSAAQALGELGDPRAVPPLLASLKDSNPAVIGLTALALGEIKDASAVDPLIAALDDPSSIVRGFAAQALGEINDNRGVLPLTKVLQDTEPRNREIAAVLLGSTHDSRAVEPLLAALQDASPYVRADAATALGRLADSRAIRPLADSLRTDLDPDVRAAAAEALGQLNDASSVEPLIAALKDPDSGVRTAAVAALGTTGDPRAAEPLRLARLDPSSGGCANPRALHAEPKNHHESYYLGIDLDRSNSDTMHFNNKDGNPQEVAIEEYDASGCLLERIEKTISAKSTLDVHVEDALTRDRTVEGWYRILSSSDKLVVSDTQDLIDGNRLYSVVRGAPTVRRTDARATVWLVDAAAKGLLPGSLQLQYFVNLSPNPVKIGVCHADVPFFACRSLNYNVASLAEVVIPIDRSHRYTLLESSSRVAVGQLVQLVNGDAKEFHTTSQLLSIGTDAVVSPAAPQCAQPPCRVP